MRFLEERFFQKQGTLRKDEASNGYFFKPIKAMTFEAMCIIADKYNKQYFSDTNKKIVLTRSLNDLKSKLLNLPQGLTQVGFTVPKTGAPENGHPVALLYEEKNDEKTLYISDGALGSLELYEEIISFCRENDIKVAINVYSRQVDNGSCKSEALSYLKNSLQQPSIAEAVTLLEGDSREVQLNKHGTSRSGGKEQILASEANIFLESADMLKTIQVSASQHKNGVEDDTPLVSVKKTMTFVEKKQRHREEVLYPQQIEGCCPPDAPKQCTFTENNYTFAKTLTHFQQVKEVVEQLDSEESLQEIIEDATNTNLVVDSSAAVYDLT